MNGKIIYRQVPDSVTLNLTRAELRILFECVRDHRTFEAKLVGELRDLLEEWELKK